MALSVRMDATLERELEAAAQRAGISKSQFIIDAVERALGRKDAYRALLKAHQDFGIAGAAASLPARQTDPAAGYSKPALKQKLAARHEAEMRDWLAFQAARARGEAWQPDDDIAQGKP